jgi:hypothetical protein
MLQSAQIPAYKLLYLARSLSCVARHARSHVVLQEPSNSYTRRVLTSIHLYRSLKTHSSAIS